ncbi:MAG: UDP-N-acetylmuramoyl-L-alanine--D-glutamate ligase [Clostridia bacterium]|nr:UDP-N-acetylmuramoyl-L-alanine--D-glutamate ligase [Clostridia bacterium]
MIQDLVNYFKGKKILILGFGREGQSTYKVIREYLPEQKIFIADLKENFEINFEILKEEKNAEYISGKGYLDNLNNYDIIMKSPGISFVGVEVDKEKIKSQLELLLEFFNIFTIGVTGTKGKSTTSSLIYKVLKDQNIDTMLLGNIGIPVFDFIDDIKENQKIVLEMSSHQLEFMKNSPNISILTNIFPEHLDHYESFEKYAEAKCNIFKYQKEEDSFIYNIDNENSVNFVKDVKSNKYTVSLRDSEADVYLKDGKVYFENEVIYSKDEPRKLLGDYNLNNIMYVLVVSKILNLDLNKTIKSISEFETLPHRLEFVGKYNDISYYDNSIATIPAATIEAVKALKSVDTLIIGGMDRGVDYTDLINFLNKSVVRNIICMPITGHDIAKKITNQNTYNVENLFDAVKIAKEVTKKEGICLLSPAAASYGFFKNFEERGDMFQKYVKE